MPTQWEYIQADCLASLGITLADIDARRDADTAACNRCGKQRADYTPEDAASVQRRGECTACATQSYLEFSAEMAALMGEEGESITMTYCSWASDDHQCDVYVYQSQDGVTVRVAAQRLTLPQGGVPPMPQTGTVSAKEWLAASQARQDIFDRCEHKPIGLSRDGQSFYGLESDEAATLLADLASEGYKVPADVIAVLRKKQAEADGAAPV